MQKLPIAVQGKELFESTEAFRKKSLEIKKEIRDKYRPDMAKANFVKRLFIFFKMKNETAKAIEQISSQRNLHYGKQ